MKTIGWIISMGFSALSLAALLITNDLSIAGLLLIPAAMSGMLAELGQA